MIKYKLIKHDNPVTLENEINDFIYKTISANTASKPELMGPVQAAGIPPKGMFLATIKYEG